MKLNYNFITKSLDIIKYKEYIKKKNEINHKLFTFYNKYIFRKLKLNSYMNRLKNEQKLMNKFQKVFGNKMILLYALVILNNESIQNIKNL